MAQFQPKKLYYMSRLAGAPLYSYNPDKFREAAIPLARQIAETSPDGLFDPRLKELHLTQISQLIYTITGGKHFGVAIYEPKDKDVILFFDAINSFADKQEYSDDELEDIGRYMRIPEGHIFDIINFIDGNQDHLTDWLKTKEIEITEEQIEPYSQYVAQSSQHFTKSLMSWLVNESGIRREGHTRDIEEAQKREAVNEGETPVLDRILLGSAFQSLAKTLETEKAAAGGARRDLAETSGIPKARIASATFGRLVTQTIPERTAG